MKLGGVTESGSQGLSKFLIKTSVWCLCVCVKVCKRHIKLHFYAGVRNPKSPNDQQNVTFSFSDGILWLCIKNTLNLGI